jgi:hypothetical protein
LPGRLLGELLGRQEAQLLVEDGQKLIRRLHIAAFHRVENPRYVVHSFLLTGCIVAQVPPGFKGQ